MKNLVKMFKRSLFKKMTLVAMIFAVLMTSSCKHDKGGGNKPKPPAPEPAPPPSTKTVKVSFRSNPVGIATITANVEGMTPVTTNEIGSIEVEVGKTIAFVASDIGDGKIPDEWVNVTSASDDKMKAELKAEKNIMVIFKVKDKPTPKVKVTYSIVNEFDEDGIHQGLLGVIDKTAGDKTVISGDEVKVGHSIHIVANPNQFNGRHRIKEWIFTNPAMTVAATQEDVVLQVLEEYADEGISFTVEFEKGEAPEPPLPEGKVRVKAGVYLWDNLEEVNFFEGGTLYSALGDEPESQGGTNMAVIKGTTVKYRLEPNAGKALYEWTGVGLDGMQIDPQDNKKVTLVANNDIHLKAIMKNEGMSIFSVFIKDENDQLVDEKVARVIAKTKNDQNELVDCRVSKKYVEGPEGKDVILQLMPQDPSYQIDTITQTPQETQIVRDQDNLNKFEVKNIKDKIVITIKMKKVETVDVTINGDDKVVAENKKTFKVHKNTTWKVLKEAQEIKDVKFSEGYELDKWTQDSASGAELDDAYLFDNTKTIFVNSKIKMRVLKYSVKDNQEKDVDSANVSLAASIEGGGNVASGDRVPYGAKVNFVATIKNKDWKINRWSWIVKEDPETQKTDHTKAFMTMGGYDVEVILTAAEAIKITIKGDDNVENESKVSFSIDKGAKWRSIKWQEQIRGVKFKEGYKLGKWLKGEDANAAELQDDDVFNTSTTIFVTSKNANLMRFTYKVKNSKWENMQDSEYEIVVKNVATSEDVANGADLPKGTKVSLKVSYKDPKLKTRYWTPDSAQDPTDSNKGQVTIGDGDMEVIMAAYEVIKITIDGDAHLKDESKTTVDTWKDQQWWLFKETDLFKNLIKFDDGWEADKYLKDNKDGDELTWDYQLKEDIKVYVTSKQKG